MTMITLKTLPQATAQEVFNQVKTHLLTQNCKSQDGEGCVYRGSNNLKCAAGILIGDDDYKPEMDDRSHPMGVNWDGLVARKLVPDTHRELIQDLQYVHDGDEPEAWGKELKGVAKAYGLAY